MSGSGNCSSISSFSEIGHWNVIKSIRWNGSFLHMNANVLLRGRWWEKEWENRMDAGNSLTDVISQLMDVWLKTLH